MLRPGTVVGDRFEVEAKAGRGGMAVVYRALDKSSGKRVALKVLHAEADPLRFAREVRAITELDHPGIVRYVGHGHTEDGRAYLAMEWLEGEDLAARLARGSLGFDEAIALGARVAEALAAGHARHVVHRDVKPENIFLVGGALGDVRIVDFGIARLPWMTAGATATGAIMGTPGYMAPEQARGEGKADARVDVFALGCVIFECLSGRRVFVGETPLAVLLKVMLEDAPRLAEVMADVPDDVDDLLARMLSRTPAERPPDGAEVATLLRQLGGSASRPTRAPAIVRAVAITPREQRLLSVVLARPRAPDPGTDATVQAGTVKGLDPLGAVRHAVATFGGRLEPVVDGTIVATLFGSGTAIDQAERAARMALAMRAALGDWSVALATGRGDVSGHWPIGDAVERAAALLSAAKPGEPCRLDELTAGLLGPGLEVQADERGLLLLAERDRPSGSGARTLLGRPTPFVGRERETATLLSIFEECLTEPVARAVVITGAAGTGKSRLRWELVRVLESRAEVLVARGDSLRAGAPFAMVAQIVRRACGVRDGEPLEGRRSRVRARVARHVALADVARVAEFLGELVGAPFDDTDSPRLRAARLDPILLGDQMRRAFEDWLAAEVEAQPIVLVLEDLQWGDRLSVEYLDAALRVLHDRPIMAVAVGRPELKEIFPSLWTDREAHEIRLGALTRSASEKLVRGVLGDATTSDRIAEIARKAAGNAFFLEELVRAEAAGKGSTTPATVLAVLQGRLEELDAGVRRLLRAGSIFGSTFWKGGLAYLLGEHEGIELRLRELVEREIVVRKTEARFPGEEEYAFRHDLVREAAYSTIDESDRVSGHGAAGTWLEEHGETATSALAEHFERGRQAHRAAVGYVTAAEQALQGNDFRAALSFIERGLSGAADDVGLRARARRVEAEALRWLGRNAESIAAARDALPLLAEGSGPWLAAASEIAIASARLGDRSALDAVSAVVIRSALGHDSDAASIVSLARIALALVVSGRPEESDRIFAHLLAREDALPNLDATARARIQETHAFRMVVTGDSAGYLAAVEAAASLYEQAGDLRGMANARVNAGYALWALGDHERAVARLREALATAERMGLPGVIATAQCNLGIALALGGAVDEGRACEEKAVAAFAHQGDKRLESGSRVYLARILEMSGDLAGAARECLRAVEIAGAFPANRAHALAVLARVRLSGGDPSGAADAIREARSIYDELGGIEVGEALLRLVEVEVTRSAGRSDEARALLAAARERLLQRAARIGDAALRESFLQAVAEHARTMRDP